MADDPNRDLLPVREGSCIDTCRSSLLDSRERHIVCKLDRYQLEDRYLRLHDEVQQLKKLSNSQEDKIKRLGTKLLRVAATPRSCLATALDFNNDKNRVDCLELENSKLKDKITVLRNQILNHTIVGRSPSRSRRLQICNSSGPTTCRSDFGRLKHSSSHLIHGREDDNSSRNLLAKIEELEKQNKEMASKITDLESQLADDKIGNQREKAAENVEYIRVWRQMKLQNEQLVSVKAENIALAEKVRELNALLDEKTRNNKEITSALLAEKKELAEMDAQLTRAKDSQLTLREKDEHIKDLTSEMKILHQHNAELLALSSKYSRVELENVELRKKISEQLSDHQSLKSAFSTEQANFTALQAANNQLMGKLQDLQRNIDSLTIQLKSFQSQNERHEKYRTEPEKLRTVTRQTSTRSLEEKFVAPSEEDFLRKPEICKNCCQDPRDRVPTSSIKRFVDREIQTDNNFAENFRNLREEKIEKKSPIRVVQRSPMRERSIQPDNASGNLTPDEMLKILEQAQINTPLDVHNAARMRQIAATSSNNYVNSVQPGQRQSESRKTKKSGQSVANDPWKTLLIMYRVLREFSDTNSPSSIVAGANPLPTSPPRATLDPVVSNFGRNDIDYSDTKVKDEPVSVGRSFSSLLDENNNTVTAKIKQEEHGEFPENMNLYNNQKQSNNKTRGYKTLENCITRERNRLNKFTETSDCTCNEKKTCGLNEDCGYACVQSICRMEDYRLDGRFVHSRCNFARSPFKSVVRDISTSIQNTFDSMHMSRLRSFKEQNGALAGLPKKEYNGKLISDFSPESDLKRQSVSSRLRESVKENSVNSESSSKRPFEASRIGNNLVFRARESSRQSKDSDVTPLMPDASSSPRQRSLLNGQPINNNNTSSRVSSAADSYLTISPSVVPQSDSSIIRAMEDEDATSSEFQNGEKKRKAGSVSKSIVEEEASSKEDRDTEKTETASVNEFNDLIRNGTILSPRESSSSVQDLGNVIADNNWKEYRRRSLASQAKSSKPSMMTTDAESRSGTSYRFSDRSISNNAAVVIRIESLALLEKCSLLHDPEVHRLYVEFSFLGYRGLELETISVTKPTGVEPALFNYMRKFEIDEEQHSMQRNIMRAIMTENDNPNIRFTVVSEPLPEEFDTKECMEVGYADFDIRDHILSRRFRERELTIVNVEQTEPIGTLKITLLGDEAIRRCMGAV